MAKLQQSGYVIVERHWRNKPGEGQQKPKKKQKQRKKRGRVSYLG